MGLSEPANHLVGHYSGGMIGRLEIAQSLLHRSKVLFLESRQSDSPPVHEKRFGITRAAHRVSMRADVQSERADLRPAIHVEPCPVGLPACNLWEVSAFIEPYQ
jgi:hypothetical protein